MEHADADGISRSGMFAYHLNKPETNRLLLVNGKQLLQRWEFRRISRPPRPVSAGLGEERAGTSDYGASC